MLRHLFGLMAPLFFRNKNNRGRLYNEYRKLSPNGIVKRLDLSDLQAEQVVFTIYQLCLYGGLHLQESLYKKGNIKSANQDAIFIEGVAYTWAILHSSIITDSKLSMVNDHTLSQGMKVGGGVLAELLSKHSGCTVTNNFAAIYQTTNMLKSDEIFVTKLLQLNSKSDSLLQDQVAIAMVAKIYSTTITQGLLESAKRVLRCYLGLPVIVDSKSAVKDTVVSNQSIPKGYGPFGLVATNPIPTSGLRGSDEYISKLQTDDGRQVTAVRIGTTSAPDVTGSIIDIYSLSAGGKVVETIYICPYFRVSSSMPPEGFLLR